MNVQLWEEYLSLGTIDTSAPAREPDAPARDVFGHYDDDRPNMGGGQGSRNFAEERGLAAAGHSLGMKKAEWRRTHPCPFEVGETIWVDFNPGQPRGERAIVTIVSTANWALYGEIAATYTVITALQGAVERQKVVGLWCDIRPEPPADWEPPAPPAPRPILKGAPQPYKPDFGPGLRRK